MNMLSRNQEPLHGGGVTCHLMIFGYGFSFQIGGYNIYRDGFVILAWGIICRHVVWRGEEHYRSSYGYMYRCIKNGVDVEKISFCSPIRSYL